MTISGCSSPFLNFYCVTHTPTSHTLITSLNNNLARNYTHIKDVFAGKLLTYAVFIISTNISQQEASFGRQNNGKPYL